MKKRSVGKGKGSSNPKRPRLSTPPARLQPRSYHRPQTNMVSLLTQNPKGKGSGKGKATTNGTRSGVPSVVSESSTSVPISNTWSPSSTTGGLGTSPSPFKGKGKLKGKFTKGKGSRPPNSGASSQIICNLCHLHGHTERNCRKKNALHHSNLTNKLVVNLTAGNNWLWIN
jgi:hypothetical protein